MGFVVGAPVWASESLVVARVLRAVMFVLVGEAELPLHRRMLTVAVKKCYLLVRSLHLIFQLL